MHIESFLLKNTKGFRNMIFRKKIYSNIIKNINRFDMYILFIIKKYIRNKYLDILMPVITCLGNFGAIWILLGIGLLLVKPYKIVGIIILITLSIGGIIGDAMIKPLVKRIRPCEKINNIKLLIKKPISYSFPSGHTLSAFAVASVLSIYFSEYTIIFMSGAFLIASSRIYLFVHYPSDVIAGVIFGVLCSKLACVIACYSFMKILLL